MSNTEQKVTSIQIAPYSITDDGSGGEVRNTQEYGADENTAGWVVYLRYDGGEVKLVDEKRHENMAIELAKQLCVEHSVSIELYRWQVEYVSPTLEALRKTYPPTIQALKNKTKLWAEHLAKVAEEAWRDGIVLGFKDRHVQVNPMPVLQGDYPNGWESISATMTIEGPEVGFLKHPEIALAGSVAKHSTYKFDGDPSVDFDKRFIGQYMPHDLGPNTGAKGVITGIVIGDEVPDDLDANRADMIDSGVRLVLDPIEHVAFGVNQSQSDLLAGTNREVADSGQWFNGKAGEASDKGESATAVTGEIVYGNTFKTVGLNTTSPVGDDEVSGSYLHQATMLNISGAATATLVDKPTVAEDGTLLVSSAEPNAVHLETSLKTGVTTRIDDTTTNERVQGKPVDLSTFTGSIDARTFETRGDHSPSKE